MNLLTLVEAFQRRRLGGTGDAAATTIGAVGLLLGTSLPARLTPSSWLASPWLSGATGAAALAYLTRQFLAPVVEDAALDSRVAVASDDPQGAEAINGGGLFIGHCKDSGLPLHITRDELTRHIFVLGATGVGKTVFAQGLMQQQIARGGGLLWVDAKLDSDNPKALLAAAMSCGRENDIVIINPGDPSQSLTYNPILRGDPDEIASRILTLVPTSEHASPGADHYRQEALQGLTTMVSALQRAGLAFNMLDLSVLLMSGAAMESLHARLTSDPRTRESEEARNFALFLDKFRHLNRMTNKLEINISKVKETFGGIGGRMYQFGTGKFGQVMNTYNPDVELYDAIRTNKIIYIALPTMGKNDVALNFAKMLLGDLRTAISWVQALPEPQRPDPPFLCVLDEMGGYATQALARPIEQSRSARIVLCSMVQSLANLDAVSKEFRQIILGNSWTKVYFKIGEHDSAYAAAETIGTEMQVLRSLSDSSSASNSTSFLRATPESTTAQGSGYATGEREAEGHRVTPDDLKALEKGDAIVTVGGSLVYNVRMSLPLALKQAIDRCGPLAVHRKARRNSPDTRGANFGRDSNKFLLSTFEQEAANRGRK